MEKQLVKLMNFLKNLFMRRKKKNDDPFPPLPIYDILEHGENRIPLINFNPYMAVSGMTFASGTYDAKIDTYTIKQYEKDDFKNLIQLLTLWIDDENIKNKIKEVADTFCGEDETEEFSEEDIDKFIMALTFEIDDQKIRNKFEETHQYWKNIKR